MIKKTISSSVKLAVLTTIICVGFISCSKVDQTHEYDPLFLLTKKWADSNPTDLTGHYDPNYYLEFN